MPLAGAGKPEWLKIRLNYGPHFMRTRSTLSSLGVATVCEEARCPNKNQCWSSGTATFLLLGNACTRRCGFCAVKTSRYGEALDPQEPERIARVAKKLNLSYVVLTSVTRDDLQDYGAGHIAECIRAVKGAGCEVEVLIPDFQGNRVALEKVVKAGPCVVAHNLETVRRLQGRVRDKRASYGTSLGLLEAVKEEDSMVTKSSLMLGLGERKEEVIEAMEDLRRAKVDILTLGQYLRPSPRHLPVVEYVPPGRFEEYKKKAEEMGFSYVASAPLVRSSYLAGSMRRRT
jgi:lipoic acid synthetase